MALRNFLLTLCFFLPLLASASMLHSSSSSHRHSSSSSSSSHRMRGQHPKPYQHRHGRVPTAASSSSSPSPEGTCKTTPYPQLCLQILSSSPHSSLHRQICVVSSVALSLTNASYHLALHVSHATPQSAPAAYAGVLQDCIDLMGNSMDQLRLSIARISHLDPAGSPEPALHAQVMDAQVSLSASFTFQDTCSDELQQHDTTPATAQLLKQGDAIGRVVSVALSLAATLQHRVSN